MSFFRALNLCRTWKLDLDPLTSHSTISNMLKCLDLDRANELPRFFEVQFVVLQLDLGLGIVRGLWMWSACNEY